MFKLFVGIVCFSIIVIVAISFVGGVHYSGLAIAAALGIALAFLLFIRAKLRETDIDSPKAGNPSTPSYGASQPHSEKALGIGLGIVAYSLALNYWWLPQTKHSTGTWAWMTNIPYDLLGPFGRSILFAIVGTLLIVSGILRSRK